MSAETRPRTIFVIRHGEKPPDPPEKPPPYGVDVDGNQNPHSLLPVGWQRAGALARLFAPQDGQFRAGLRTPTQLIAPEYDDVPASKERTHETIHPLEQLLYLDVTPFDEKHPDLLGKSVAATQTGVTLICWEHRGIPVIAENIAPPGTKIPKSWPDDRFDVIWSFTLDAGSGTYVFEQIPQMLLAHDCPEPIAV